MRHRVVVITTVLAVAVAAGCSRDKHDRPAPQAQAPVSSASAPAESTTTPGPPATQDQTGATTKTGSTSPTDPAGAVKGHPQTLPTGTDINAVGIGPYTIGQEESALTTAKLIGAVKAGATGCDSGTGVAKWGSPTLFLTKGKLQHVKITTAAVRTTAGIKVGSSEASVKTAYPQGSVTAGRAWYVPTGAFALLFRLAGGKVTAVEAGPASILETGAPGC
ncbi:hypothetical protein [Actinoplanes sp. NPDC051411]|uniref:hypothetical protein n=1 Tax=Actinoplanes sp. NPDC051411 TaxID=3155522 RepID=UPI00344A7F87